MTSFSISNSPDCYIDIDTNFIYNFYSYDETQTNDSFIIDNKNDFYKCIELKVDARSKYNNKIIQYYNNSSAEDFYKINNNS